MSELNRRTVLAGLAGAGLVAPAGPAPWPRERAGHTGCCSTRPFRPAAWLLLAQDNGHLDRDGLDLAFTTGAGAFTAAPRMAAGRFDLGYGDINSLIEVAPKSAGETPVGVFSMFNASPSTSRSRRTGRRRPRTSRRARSAATRPTSPSERSEPSARPPASTARGSRSSISTGRCGRRSKHAALGEVDGVSGYVSTIAAALASANMEAAQAVRFICFAEHVPDFTAAR